MVRYFFAWWLRQLLELLPRRLRRAQRDGIGDAVLLRLDEPAAGPPVLDATRRRGQRDVALGRYTLDGPGLDRLRAAVGTARRGAIRVLLPPRLLLEREVALPLAAERGLKTALRWEMDRLTPFSADAVFWGWTVEARDRVHARLTLRLRLVTKASITPVLERLAAAGLPVSMLVSGNDPTRTIALDRDDRPNNDSRALAVAAAMLGILVVVALALPLVRQELAFRKTGERIAALRPQIVLADGLRQRLAERAASADVLAAEASRVGDALQMLAIVTDVLPDDTYLYGLTLRNRMLTINGQSGAAAKLIPALASDPAIRDPVFAAPVMRNEVTGTEAFSIRAEMK